MLHKAWNSKEEMPFCFPRSSIKFQSHTVQNITDFDPNWAFPDYRLVAAFKSLRFALFTDDLHDNLSWVPASDKPHTFKSCFTHSSQVFFGRPGPFLPGTRLDLTLFISPLERMTCPNHLSRRSWTRMARSHIPSLACSSSIDGSSDGLTPQIQRIIARSLRHSRWRAAEVMGQVSVPCNIELRTLELNRRPLRSKGTGLDVSKGRFSRNLPQAHLHLAVAAAMQPPPALSMSPR